MFLFATVQHEGQTARQQRTWKGHCASLMPAFALWSAIAVALVLLARGLPTRTFFAGDSGVKLIVARNAIEHPTHPLDIDLPALAISRSIFWTRSFTSKANTLTPRHQTCSL